MSRHKKSKVSKSLWSHKTLSFLLLLR